MNGTERTLAILALAISAVGVVASVAEIVAEWLFRPRFPMPLSFQIRNATTRTFAVFRRPTNFIPIAWVNWLFLALFLTSCITLAFLLIRKTEGKASQNLQLT